MRFRGEFIGHRHVCNTQRFGLSIALSGFPLRWAICLLEWLLFWMRSMENTNCIIHGMQASNGSNEWWAPFCYWQGRLREELCTITRVSARSCCSTAKAKQRVAGGLPRGLEVFEQVFRSSDPRWNLSLKEKKVVLVEILYMSCHFWTSCFAQIWNVSVSHFKWQMVH